MRKNPTVKKLEKTLTVKLAIKIPKRLRASFSMLLFRRSHQRCSVSKGVLRNFEKFTGKHLCQSLFFNEDASRPATLLKKRFWHRCFPMNFAKFLKNNFFRTPLGDCFCLFLIFFWFPDEDDFLQLGNLRNVLFTYTPCLSIPVWTAWLNG